MYCFKATLNSESRERVRYIVYTAEIEEVRVLSWSKYSWAWPANIVETCFYPPKINVGTIG